MAFKFETLVVWQKSLDMTIEIHLLTREFPKDERFIISSQIKRAADSICLNIAEGSTGQSNKEFARFLTIANRSALKVVACLFICKKRNYITQEIFSFFLQFFNRNHKNATGIKK